MKLFAKSTSMSRIGKQPIELPAGVTVDVAPGNVTVKGPKGELSQHIPTSVSVAVEGTTVTVSVPDQEDKQQRAYWGLAQRLIDNMVKGVVDGYEKKLEVHGVGYKVSASGKKVTLGVGFSHPVDFEVPDGLEAAVEKNVITISGIDKQLVGEVAAQIRRVRPPEPYKGKGIRYADEVVRRKAGKQAK